MVNEKTNVQNGIINVCLMSNDISRCMARHLRFLAVCKTNFPFIEWLYQRFRELIHAHQAYVYVHIQRMCMFRMLPIGKKSLIINPKWTGHISFVIMITKKNERKEKWLQLCQHSFFFSFTLFDTIFDRLHSLCWVSCFHLFLCFD